MTRFIDGPAAKVELALSRSPVFLRVVCDRDGRWDALDLVTDKPRPDESVYCYRRKGPSTTVHVDFRDKRGRKGEWYALATYSAVQDPPPVEILRNTTFWQAWATNRYRESTQKGSDGPQKP